VRVLRWQTAARNEGKGTPLAAEVGTRKGAPSTGLWLMGLGLRLSIPVGTRKMVNYA
jgi:hypothetical protein